MPVSPADFALWARATGNKYPETAEEKLAAAPHAYSFSKNVTKTGVNAPGARVGGSIFYDRPEAVENNAPNSLFNAPVTPDNRAPKVAGTVDSTLTSEHFQNDEENEALEHQEQHSLLGTVGKAALAAGAVAAGLAVARTPGGQQALQTAETTVKENAQNIGNRVSSFLGGLGGGRTVDPDVIRNSGDITPPTTAQRYNQEVVPSVTQEVQVAKGAPTGSALEATLPPTSESYATKPVTESDVITSSQSFSPRSAYEGGSQALQSLEQAVPSSEAVKTARIETAKQDLLSAAQARKGETYQREIPGISPTLMAVRSPLAGVDLEKNIDLATGESLGLVQPSAETGSTISPTTEQYSLLSQTPDPWTGKYTPTAQALDLGEQTSRLMPSAEPKSTPLFNPPHQPSAKWREQHKYGPSGSKGVEFFPTEEGKYVPGIRPDITLGSSGYGYPTRHETVPAPKLGGRSLVRTGGGEQPTKVSVERSFDLGDAPTFGSRDVTNAFLKEQVQKLPGARDVEAAIATQQAQGVHPSGRYSSLVSGKEFEPSWGASSMIDPRIVTAGKQPVAKEAVGNLSGAMERLGTLHGQIKAEADPRALTFLKQVSSLHDITQDPAILEAGSQGALPINVTLPGGETVPTKSFFRPHGAVGAGEGSNLTQVQALEGNVIGKQTVLGNVKAGILKQFGLGPTERITNKMFNELPQSQRKVLMTAHNNLVDAQTRLSAAKENQFLYSIPENVLEGTKTAPVISQTTGEIVGSTAVPEERTMSTPEFYKMRAGGGAGRQEVGGVGRRREALADVGYTAGQGSPSDVTPVLYKHKDTGEILTADNVTMAEIGYGTVAPIRGTAVEPQRIMGREGRTFKGVSANVIDPASFDPGQHKAMAEAYPERVSPEGLIYSAEAMERPSGYTKPTLGTRFAPFQKLNPRAVAARRETEAIARGEQAPGPVSITYHPSTRLDPAETRTATPAEKAFAMARLHGAVWGENLAPSQTIPLESPVVPTSTHITHAFQPQQLSIPGAGLTPQIQSTPALEEAIETERYMGTRPGQQLRFAMQKALAKAGTRQPSLF